MRKAESFRFGLLVLALIAGTLAGTLAATLAARARSSWKIDPSHTQVLFSVDATAWPRTTGEFKSFDGRIDIDFDKPARSKVVFRVAANSVDTGSPGLNDYLRGEAFFNAARFPYMNFVSTRVEKRDGRHARVTGELTLLGVTRPVSLDVAVDRKEGASQRVGFRASGVINRLDFGMTSGYPAISNAIDITVTTQASIEP